MTTAEVEIRRQLQDAFEKTGDVRFSAAIEAMDEHAEAIRRLIESALKRK